MVPAVFVKRTGLQNIGLAKPRFRNTRQKRTQSEFIQFVFHSPPSAIRLYFVHPYLGRLIFVHHHCWEVLPFLTSQRQRCIKFRVLRAQDFYTPLPLNCQKGKHLPALVVYKNQSPILPLFHESLANGDARFWCAQGQGI